MADKFNGVTFYGIIHQSGGCGPELSGAIDLLLSKKIPVRCLLPKQAPGEVSQFQDRIDFLKTKGVEAVPYTAGDFSTCKVLMTFGEHKCFDYMREHSDRPKYMVWSSCMSWSVSEDIFALTDGLIDEFFFQTPDSTRLVAPQIQTRASKEVYYRNGYVPYINPASDYFQHSEFIGKHRSQFLVSKAVRDDPNKWDPSHWDMCYRVSKPAHKSLHFEIFGWGDNAKQKISDPAFPESPWYKKFNIAWRTHCNDPIEVSKLYGRSHVLLHYYPFIETFGFATLQAMLAKAVPIAAPQGGFLNLIQHNRTGFLATSIDEAAYFTSKLAFEEDTCKRMAEAAAKWVVEEGPGNPDKCWPWWEELLKKCEVSF